MDQLDFYRHKLAYEMDSADLYEALEKGEPIVVVDGRTATAYAREHIPARLTCPTGRSVSNRRSRSIGPNSTFVTATESDATPRQRRP